MLLTPRVYQKLNGRPGPFGLCHFQKRTKNIDRVVPHGFWYNQDGFYLGEGDISDDDLLSVRDQITEPEGMIIIPVSAYGIDYTKYDAIGWPGFIHLDDPQVRVRKWPEELLGIHPVIPFLVKPGRIFSVLKDPDAVLRHQVKLRIVKPFGPEPITLEYALKVVLQETSLAT